MTPARAPRLAFFVAATVTLLGLLHYVLLFVVDAPPVLLRLSTLVVALLLGYGMLHRSALSMPMRAACSTIAAALSVTLMLGITALIDGVPLWPQGARDVQELAEYFLGIALAHLGGGLVPWSSQRLRRLQRAARMRDAAAGASLRLRLRIAMANRVVQQLATAVAPVVSCATAFYSGLKVFMGG